MPVTALLATLLVLFHLLAAPVGAEPVELHVQTGHTAEVLCVAFGPDERLALSGGYDRTLRLWQVETREELRALTGHGAGVRCAAFSPDGKLAASAADDRTVRLWNLESGEALAVLAAAEVGKSLPRALCFSPDGALLACGGDGGVVRLWSVADRARRADLRAPGPVQRLAFSSDGAFLAAGGPEAPLHLWRLADLGPVATFRTRTDGVLDLQFTGDDAVSTLVRSPQPGHPVQRLDLRLRGKDLDATLGSRLEGARAAALGPGGETVLLQDGAARVFRPGSASALELPLQGRPYCVAVGSRQVLVGCSQGWLERFEKSSGRSLGSLRATVEPVTSLAFLHAGRALATGDWAGRVRIWRLDSAGWVDTVPSGSGPVQALAVSSRGDQLAAACWDDRIRSWRVTPSQTFSTASTPFSSPTSVAFLGAGALLCGGAETVLARWQPGAPPRPVGPLGGPATRSVAAHGDLVAAASEDGDVALWPQGLPGPSRSRRLHRGMATAVAFDSRGELLASAGRDGRVVLQSAHGGAPLAELQASGQELFCVGFRPDGKTLAAGSGSGEVWLWDSPWRESPRKLQGHTRSVEALSFDPGGAWLATASADGTVRIWNPDTGRELVRLMGSGTTDWVAMDPLGRFDGSQQGLRDVHLVMGIEAVDLAQLKNRYFEPGLLQKVLGSDPGSLRPVPPLAELGLFPQARVLSEPSPKLRLELTPRGGGVGPVEVRVNGVQTALVQPAAGQTELTVDLSGARLLAGSENPVEVITYSSDGAVSSRATRIPWPGAIRQAPPSSLFLIVAGITRYEDPKLQLKFAGQDASAVARILTLGGRRLLGPDRVHTTVLADEPGDGELEVVAPTRENFERALSEVAARSRPEDLIVLYLSGHGMSAGDRYAFLTRETRLGTGIPAAGALTGEDLHQWLSRVAAVRRVLVLDTCASGAAALELGQFAPVRPMDRLGAEQNLHLLMGCSGSAESYESADYGHGFLTYALLRGLQGPALREGEYADVLGLFRFASNEVPQLAARAGRVQKPRISTPGAGENFDLAQVGEAERKSIVLATPRPLVLAPRLLDLEATDPLNLEELLAVALTQLEQNEAVLDFRSESALAGAFQPRGTYSLEAGNVRVTLSLSRDGQKVAGRVIEGSSADVSGLVAALRDAIVEEVRRQR